MSDLSDLLKAIAEGRTVNINVTQLGPSVDNTSSRHQASIKGIAQQSDAEILESIIELVGELKRRQS